MRLDHLLSKENVRCQITDVSYSKSTSDLVSDELLQSVSPIFCIYSIFRTRVGFLKNQSGGIAQLGERLPCKQEVAGSIPAVSTKQDNDPAPEENKVRL